MSDIEQLLKDAVAAVNRMTPEQLAEMREAQRRSWVTGELMLEHPDMTKEEANRLYDKFSRQSITRIDTEHDGGLSDPIRMIGEPMPTTGGRVKG